MGGLVSKSSKSAKQTITEADKAVLSLKTQRRKLQAERNRVEGLVEREIQVAKELLAQKKRNRALLTLKKKKLQEQQLERIDAYLLNVEEVLSNVESAQRTVVLFNTLKQGNAALKEIQAQVPLEAVERLMDDTAEAKEYEDRVRELLGESLSAEDDEVVLKELETLEEQALEEEVAAMPTPPQVPEAAKLPSKGEEELPEAPTHALATQEVEEEKAVEEPIPAS